MIPLNADFAVILKLQILKAKPCQPFVVGNETGYWLPEAQALGFQQWLQRNGYEWQRVGQTNHLVRPGAQITIWICRQSLLGDRSVHLVRSV